MTNNRATRFKPCQFICSAIGSLIRCCRFQPPRGLAERATSDHKTDGANATAQREIGQMDCSYECLPTITIQRTSTKWCPCSTWSVHTDTACEHSDKNVSSERSCSVKFRRRAQRWARCVAQNLPRGAHIVDRKSDQVEFSYIVLPRRYARQLYDGTPVMLKIAIAALASFFMVWWLMSVGFNGLGHPLHTVQHSMRDWESAILAAVVAVSGLVAAAALTVAASTLTDSVARWEYRNNLWRKAYGIVFASLLATVCAIIVLVLDFELSSGWLAIELTAHTLAVAGTVLVIFLLLRMIAHLHHYSRYARSQPDLEKNP